jgi:uncharacterized protein GlcG (DUF336 family)
MSLGISEARRMIAAAEHRASSLGINSTVVVLDAGGDIVAVERMDGAWPGGFDLAYGKAQTSRAFRAPSAAFVPLIQPTQPLFSVNAVNSGRYVIIGGGLPIQDGESWIGAIGVSGGSPDQDIEVAEAALRSFTLEGTQSQGSPNVDDIA